MRSMCFSRSLQRTTAEIQNYSFDGSMGKLLDRDRDTTSQDSGISQMSAGQCDRLDVLEERFEDLSIASLKLHNNVSHRAFSTLNPFHIILLVFCLRGIKKDNMFNINGQTKEVVPEKLRAEYEFYLNEVKG